MKIIMNKKQLLINIFVLLAVFIASFCVFSKMIDGLIMSDFTAHINSALNNEGYSIVAILIKLCCFITPNKFCVKILMSLFVVLTVVVVAILMEKIIDDKENNYFMLMPTAASTIFMAKIAIVGLSDQYHHRLSFATQPWHNSTYTLMRLIGIIVIIDFFLLLKKGIKELKAKDYIVFAFLLTLTNLVKPNFIIGFAPSLLVFLIILFIKDIRNFVPCLKNGVCVLISLVVLVIQYKILYVDSNNGSSIAFSLDNVIYYILMDRKSLLHLFLSYVYPIFSFYVIIFKCKLSKEENKIYLFSLLCVFVSELEYLFLVEKGPRSSHGNFSWGGYFFYFLLTIVSMSLIIKKHNNKLIEEKFYYLTKYAYILQFISGVIYYILILTGVNFPWKI